MDNIIESKPFAVSADGTDIHAAQYGAGHDVVIVHGGMGAAWNWQAVGELLAPRFRITAIERRGYGRSGPSKMPHSMAREAEDVRAVLAQLGKPAVVVGHSSGGVVTLETALTHPPTLRGIVLYEPPVQLGTPLGGDAQPRAEAALAAGDPSTTLRIFFSELVQLPSQAVEYMATSPDFAGGWQEMQRLAPAQMEDNRGIRALPLGIERFRAVDVPALLLRGSDSPKHLHERLDALAGVLPVSESATLAREDHTANLTAPQMVADAIAPFAQRLLS